MPQVRVAFLGDVVGEPGRRACAAAVPVLRRERNCDLVIVNGENARHGSGLHPQGCDELLAAGVDAITLGDHALDDERIRTLLADRRVPVTRPYNFPGADPSWQWFHVLETRGGPPIVVVTVLCRLFMSKVIEEPFAQLDAAMRELLGAHHDALVLVEIHGEATSEKQGTAWHARRTWPGKVVAVLGTHTHTQTNDARLIEGELAAVTDVGFTGGHEGIIGFTAEDSMRRIREQRGRLSIAEGDPRADGAIVVIDTDRRVAESVRVVSIAAGG